MSYYTLSEATVLLVLSLLLLGFQPYYYAGAFRPVYKAPLQQQPHTLATHASLSSADLISATDFRLDDFKDSHDELDAATEDLVVDEEDVSALVFLEMVEQTPAGELQDAELEILREILLSITLETEGLDVSIPDLADRLLCRWMEEWQERPCTVELTTYEFYLVMRSWGAQIGSDPQKRNAQLLPTAVDRVTSLFMILEDLYDASQDVALKPNANVFRVVLSAMATSRDHDMDRKAERLFLRMQQVYDVEADAEMYELLIHMIAKSRNNGAANRAEKLLRDAVACFPSSISIASFNVVLTAWAKSGTEYGPERAEKLMVLMDEVGVQPSVSSFTSLIDAYSQTNTWDGASHCERIFNRVLDLFVTDGDDRFEPSIVSWTVVMSAWGRLAKKNFKGAGERADKLLRRMEALHADGRINFGPDHIVYITCMNANASSKTVEGLTRAREILDEMNERYLDGDDSFKPSARSIRVLIDCWIRSTLPDKMDGAESVLDSYKDHLDALLRAPTDSPEVLDVVKEIYESILFGWTQDGDPILAQQYLEEMVDKGLEPDSFCFDRVIKANAHLNDPGAMKRSYAIFQLMEDCRMRGVVCPNERVYTSFIRAMIKARVQGLAQKSNSILNRMQALYDEGNKSIKPTVFTYNAVLLACAESASSEDAEQPKKDALKVAVTIFNDLRSDGTSDEPDHVSFGNMLRCSNLLPPGPQKDTLVTSVFQLCCKRGFVNQFILRDLRLVARGELWKELLGCSQPDDEVTIEGLPESWRHRTYDKPCKPERPAAMRSFKPERSSARTYRR